MYIYIFTLGMFIESRHLLDSMNLDITAQVGLLVCDPVGPCEVGSGPISANGPQVISGL